MQGKVVFLSSMIGLGVLLLACTSNPSASQSSTSSSTSEPSPVNRYNPGQSVASDEVGAMQTPAVVLERQALMIEGNIVQVMESDPLQLMVETSSGRYQIALQPETTITQKGQIIVPSSLKSGVRVKVTGQQSSIDSHAMTAKAIEIQ